MLTIHFPCNGQEVNEYFLEWKKEEDGKWLTFPHTEVRSNRTSLCLGPLKYVLWVGGSVNGVELSFLDPDPGGDHDPASLWELSGEESGTGIREVPLGHVSSCWTRKVLDLGSEHMGLSKAKALAQGDLALLIHAFSPYTFVQRLLWAKYRNRPWVELNETQPQAPFSSRIL